MKIQKVYDKGYGIDGWLEDGPIYGCSRYKIIEEYGKD